MSQAGTAAATGDTGATTTAAAAQTTTTTATTAAAAPWFNGLDAEFVGTLQNRGLDKKSEKDAALDFYKAHKEASQLISRITGTPDKERILIQPKPDSTDAEKTAFYEKLGRPAKADDYDFSAVKFPDGTALDDHYRDFLRASAFKANMSKDAATAFAQEHVAYLNSINTGATTEAQAKLAEEKRALDANWGANKEANTFIAKQAALKLGFTVEAANALEKAAGYKAVMESLLRAGQALGEDKFVRGTGTTQTGVMTREQAEAKYQELRQDKAWLARYHSGDRAAMAEAQALAVMRTPGQRQAA